MLISEEMCSFQIKIKADKGFLFFWMVTVEDGFEINIIIEYLINRISASYSGSTKGCDLHVQSAARNVNAVFSTV